jgi:hypothetical protein
VQPFLKYFFPAIVTSIILFYGCEKEVKVIPEEKFINVYVDLLILQDTTSTDSLSLDSLKTLVFKNHNVSAEEYDATIRYYNSEPKKWEDFFDKAVNYVEALKKEAEK